MAQALLIPNPENASLADLYAAQRAGNRETNRRCTVVILLLTGSSREQAMHAFDLSESAVKKIVRAFNSYGIDGLKMQLSDKMTIGDGEPSSSTS